MNKREWKARRWRLKAAKRRRRLVLAAYDRIGRAIGPALDTPAHRWFDLTPAGEVTHWDFAARRCEVDWFIVEWKPPEQETRMLIGP